MRKLTILALAVATFAGVGGAAGQNARNSGEAGRLTCRLGHEHVGGSYLIQGVCSGPFATVSVAPPPGTRLDPKVPPDVEGAHRCRSIDGRLLCAMATTPTRDRRGVRIGFGFLGTPKGPARVRFGDATGRPVAWTASDRVGGRRDPSADLRIDVSGPVRHVHDPREGNQRIDYRIRVRNAGPAESPGGVVAYDVRGAKPGLWDVYSGGWVQRPCKFKLRQCVLAKMPAGATAEIIVSVPAPPGRVRTGTPKDDVSVTAEATVVGEAPDPVKLSNTDVATTQVEPAGTDIEVHFAAEPERVTINKLTGVAVARLSALVRNLGPLSLRAGEASIVFRSFRATGVKLVRTFGEVPCDQDADPQVFAAGCELGVIGAGGGFNVSISVSFSAPGRYSIEALASARIGNSIFTERSDTEFATVEVLPAPD